MPMSHERNFHCIRKCTLNVLETNLQVKRSAFDSACQSVFLRDNYEAVTRPQGYSFTTNQLPLTFYDSSYAPTKFITRISNSGISEDSTQGPTAKKLDHEPEMRNTDEQHRMAAR
nr:PREDICTED: uncharacterized protein LOC105661968 [Megachile rotundata]